MISSYLKKRGFTLIELMVSVSIFILVMTISMGAILAILDANQKSETERSVLNNLSSTVEDMTRTIRFGTNYHATSLVSGSCDLTTPRDTFVSDRDSNGNSNETSSLTVLDSSGEEITYGLVSGQITRSVNSGTPLFLTSPDVNIQTLSFRVYGSYPYTDTGCGHDTLQPFVMIVITGTVVGKGSTGSSFTVQTSVSQRALDSQ